MPGFRVGRALVVCGLSYPVIVILFIALLASTLALSSDSRIESHLRAAILQGMFPPDDSVDPVSPYGHDGHQFDLNGECEVLGMNLANFDLPLFHRVVVSEMRDCRPLIARVARGREIRAEAYFRYWHGYQVYTRPMLSVMSYTSMRRANAIILFAAFGFLCWRFARAFGSLAWPILVVPFAVVGDLMTVPLVTGHAVNLAWIFLSVALFAVVVDGPTAMHPVIVPTALFAAGAIANFVDVLFNPPLAPTLMGFFVMAGGLSRSEQTRVGPAVRNLVVVIGFWGAGYALAWTAKWVLAAAVFGVETVATNVTGAAAGNVLQPSGGVRGVEFVGEASWIVVSSGAKYVLTLIAVSWGAAAAILGWTHASRRRLSRKELIAFGVLQLPLLLPVVSAEVLRMHSLSHPGFVYRDFLPFAILPLLAALMVARAGRDRDADAPPGRLAAG